MQVRARWSAVPCHRIGHACQGNANGLARPQAAAQPWGHQMKSWPSNWFRRVSSITRGLSPARITTSAPFWLAAERMLAKLSKRTKWETSISSSPFSKSVIRSVPPLKTKRSAPSPPSNVWRPPPVTAMSLPSPALIRSLPPSAQMTSLPDPLGGHCCLTHPGSGRRLHRRRWCRFRHRLTGCRRPTCQGSGRPRSCRFSGCRRRFRDRSPCQFLLQGR